ncbi:MAG: hypothetical protein LUE27_05400 [Clostridia bacterium]|nr:hypothetical protein [Clostridia bacterium]
MKGIITFLMALLLLAFPAGGAQETIPSEARIAFDVKTALEKDGIEAKLTGDGGIVFTYKGGSFSIDFAKDGDELYYVRLSQSYKYGSTVTREVLDLFNKEINYKIVKVICSKTGYSLRVELLMKDANYFKQIYPRLLELIDGAGSTIRAKAPELSERIEKEKVEKQRADSLRIAAEVADIIAARELKDSVNIMERSDSTLIMEPKDSIVDPMKDTDEVNGEESTEDDSDTVERLSV